MAQVMQFELTIVASYGANALFGSSSNYVTNESSKNDIDDHLMTFYMRLLRLKSRRYYSLIQHNIAWLMRA